LFHAPSTRPYPHLRGYLPKPVNAYYNAHMKTFRSVLLGALIGAGGMMLYGQSERAMHPRIAAAITSINDAIAYMEAAPHDFGGHKASAIQSSRHAVEQLKLALAYRAKQDHK
jgi:hypothetical protein